MGWEKKRLWEILQEKKLIFKNWKKKHYTEMSLFMKQDLLQRKRKRRGSLHADRICWQPQPGSCRSGSGLWKEVAKGQVLGGSHKGSKWEGQGQHPERGIRVWLKHTSASVNVPESPVLWIPESPWQCFSACKIFQHQGSNPCPLHWQADS